MSTDKTQYSITELAREFDITTRTIRFYEDKALLKPSRRGQTRVYSNSDRTRLKLVLRGKRLGWPLDEIHEMIQLYNQPDGEKQQLEMMLDKVERSRIALLKQQEDITIALMEFDEIAARCQHQLQQITHKKVAK